MASEYQKLGNVGALSGQEMGSRNAFASSLNGTTRSRDIEEEQNNTQPPKRVRLSDDAAAAIQMQSAQVDTSLEVDHMVLDYAAYQTIRACLATRDPKQQANSSLTTSLNMSDAFVSIFRARHPLHKPDVELRFRILLLKFVTLFTQRLTRSPTIPSRPALQMLRADNQERAREWIGSADRIPSSSLDVTQFDASLPLPVQALERNRAHVLHALGVPAEDEDYEDAFYGTAGSISLLDLIPLFMRVSAARNAMNQSNLTGRWMQLASEFMLQACLEQYLVYGAQGLDAVDEAFAWGYKEHSPNDASAEVGDEMFTCQDNEVESMFEDEDYEMEVEDWNSTRLSYLHQLLPLSIPGEDKAPTEFTSDDDSSDWTAFVAHLESVAKKHSIGAFETSMLSFLSALANSIAKPVIIQLENGRLDGMTEQQTRDFLTGCGGGPARFFESPAGFKISLN